MGSVEPERAANDIVYFILNELRKFLLWKGEEQSRGISFFVISK